MCKHQLSKFDDCTDEYVMSIAHDEEASSGYGWYGLAKGPLLDLPQPGDIPFAPKLFDMGVPQTLEMRECVEKEFSFLLKQKGAIVHERTDGIVEVTYYDFSETKKMETDWDNIIAEQDEYYGISED